MLVGAGGLDKKGLLSSFPRRKHFGRLKQGGCGGGEARWEVHGTVGNRVLALGLQGKRGNTFFGIKGNQGAILQVLITTNAVFT